MEKKHAQRSAVVKGQGQAFPQDFEGSELKRYMLSAPVGQSFIDTREFAPGTYTVDLVNGGDRISTKRLVLKP